MIYRRQLLFSSIFFGALSALTGCDEGVSLYSLPADEEILNKKQQEDSQPKKPTLIETSPKVIPQAQSEHVLEQSFLLVVRVPEPKIDEKFLRERLSNPEDRLKPKSKFPIPKDSDVPKILLPDNEKILKDIAEKLELKTGHTPVILKSASTLVIDLTKAELDEIENWEEIQEIIPNYKVER